MDDKTQLEQTTDINPENIPQPSVDLEPSTEQEQQPVLSPVVESKKRRPLLVIGAIVAGILVVVGGSGVLAYNVWYQNPDKVVHDALISAFTAKTVIGTGDITIKSPDYKLSLSLDGKSDETSGSFGVKASVTGLEGQDGALTLSGSGVFKENTLYFKLEGVKKAVKDLRETDGGIPEYLDSIIDKLDGQWVSVKSSDYEDISEETSKQQECTMKTFESLNTNDAMQKELISLYSENRVITIKDQLGSRDIKGVDSLGYLVEINKGATERFIRGLDSTAFGKAIKDCDKEVNFIQTADEIAEAEESSDMPTLALWVSRFGHQITQASLSAEEGETSLSAVLNPTFNQEVSVDVPENAISAKQLIEDIQESITKYYLELYSESSIYPEGYNAEDLPVYNFN